MICGQIIDLKIPDFLLFSISIFFTQFFGSTYNAQTNANRRKSTRTDAKWHKPSLHIIGTYNAQTKIYSKFLKSGTNLQFWTKFCLASHGLRIIGTYNVQTKIYSNPTQTDANQYKRGLRSLGT